MFKNNISSKDLKGSQGQDKVSWIKEMLHTFCDIYIKAIEKMHEAKHVFLQSWIEIHYKYLQRADRAYINEITIEE